MVTVQGFHKIDPDKWEFANEGFLRGKRHLLREIHRRKSPHSQQLSSYGWSSAETGKSELGTEIQKLREEKSALMQEVVELQKQQRGTAERMKTVKDRIEASEQRQKQMVSFLAKVVQNPEFPQRLKKMKEKQRTTLDSPRTRRKFLKQKQQESCSSGSSTAIEAQVVRYRPDSSDIPAPSTRDYLLEDVVGTFSMGIENISFQIEDVPLDELAAAQELMDIPDAVGPGFGDSFSRGKESVAEYFVSYPEELVKERTFPGFPSPGIENIMKQEEVWSMGFDLNAGMSCSSSGLWGNVGSYDVGTSGPGEFSDIVDLGSLVAGSSGFEKWPSDESPIGDPENRALESKDDVGSRDT